MKIFVRYLTATIELAVQPFTTIDEIKRQIQDKNGIPPNQQRLFYGGKGIGGGSPISSVGLQNEATISLVRSSETAINPRAVLEEVAVNLSPDQVKRRVNHWRSLAQGSLFDDDMDIVDPGTYKQYLELLADTVAEKSEFKRCNGEYSTADESTWDLKVINTGGLHGIPTWMWSAFGTIEDNSSPSQSRLIEGIRKNLWKTCLILSQVLFSFRELERQRFCKDSFNLLLKLPEFDVAEIIRIPITNVEAIQIAVVHFFHLIRHHNNVEGFDITDQVQPVLLDVLLPPCNLLLKRLQQSVDTEKLMFGDVLAISRVVALLLDLALVSYSHSHGHRLDHQYLGRDASAFEVDFAGAFSFRCSLMRLGCLRQFLDMRDVWVFELRTDHLVWKEPQTHPIAILTKMKDFADIWGPVYPVREPRRTDRIRQYNVSKGIICRAGGTKPTLRNAIQCHWYNRVSWLRGLRIKLLPPSAGSCLSPDDLLLINGMMVEKETCNYTLDAYEADYGNELNELGTKHSIWRWDTRGVSLGISKIAGATVMGNQKLIPETTLKEKILDKWASDPDTRNSHVLVQMLGVEVSHCTGNARRIAVRTILTLKPMALALDEGFPGWKDRPWGPAFLAAVTAEHDSDMKEVWKELKQYRKEMGTLIYFALDLLSTTGLDGSNFKVAFLRDGQESSIDLVLGVNSWALVLKDTPNTASFATMGDTCLLFNMPNHSAASCSVSCGPERAHTTLYTRLATGPLTIQSAAWQRVFLKKIDEKFQKTDAGSPHIVLLRPLGLTPYFLTRDITVEGLEIRDPGSRWGDKGAVFFQASEPSYGGMSRARTLPPPMVIEPAMNKIASQTTSGTRDSNSDRPSVLELGQLILARPSSSLDHQQELALESQTPEGHAPLPYTTENGRKVEDDRKEEIQVETALDIRQASPMQKRVRILRSPLKKLKENLRRLLN